MCVWLVANSEASSQDSEDDDDDDDDSDEAADAASSVNGQYFLVSLVLHLYSLLLICLCMLLYTSYYTGCMSMWRVLGSLLKVIFYFYTVSHIQHLQLHALFCWWLYTTDRLLITFFQSYKFMFCDITSTAAYFVNCNAAKTKTYMYYACWVTEVKAFRAVSDIDSNWCQNCALGLCRLHLGDSQGLCSDETCKRFCFYLIVCH